MIVTDDELFLIDQIKPYLTRFLKDMGGFYPFAVGLKKNRKIQSIAASDGTEFPDAHVLIDLLNKSIPEDLSKGRFVLAAICVDIFVHEDINGIDTKKDAIQIKFISKSYRKTLHLFYTLNEENDVTFGGMESVDFLDYSDS